MKLINENIINDGMIADMEPNKNLQAINTELLIRGKKPKISEVFISRLYFTLPKNKKLHTTYYFVKKTPNIRTHRFK